MKNNELPTIQLNDLEPTAFGKTKIMLGVLGYIFVVSLVCFSQYMLIKQAILSV